jgi:hypothetical protein
MANCRLRGRDSLPDPSGVWLVFTKYSKVAYQVARQNSAVAAPRVERPDLSFSLELVVSDDIMPIRHKKLMRLFATVFVNVGPVISDEPIERTTAANNLCLAFFDPP